MEFLSIRNLLKTEKPVPVDCPRLIGLLLQGIALHAVEADPADLSAFRSALSRIADHLNENASPEELLGGVGAANRLHEDYNRKVTHQTKGHSRELQVILAMMTETIAYLGKSSASGINQLKVLERDLEQAASSSDIHKLREKIAECLETVRREGTRLNSESTTQIGLMNEGLERTKIHLQATGSGAELDPVTRLPGRAALELRVSDAIARRTGDVLVMLLVNGLNSINGRYGRTAGDAVLLLTAEHLTGQLPAKTSVYRWSGPAFVIAFDADSFTMALQGKVRTIASAKLEKALELAGRSVLLSVSFTWIVQKLAVEDSAAVVFGKLDEFAAAHTT